MATCNADGCSKAATMRCPTCQSLGADKESHFCSKECFQSSWEVHKLVHKKYKDAQNAAIALLQSAGAISGKAGVRVAKGFDGFTFTGPLRPGDVSPMMKVTQKGVQKPDYAESGIPKSELAERGSNVIPTHTPAQLQSMREVCRLGRQVLDICAAALKPGVTTDTIDRICFDACMERGLYPSPLNYHGFPKSICTSVNEIICHGIPDSRPLEDGDIVNLDVSVYLKGHHADLNETYFVGKVDEKGHHLLKTAYECLAAAIAVCKPGAMYRDIGNAIQKVANEANLSVVKTYCGHGVGRMFHTSPSVPHYGKNKAVGIIRAGHIFTIEPMINEGVSGDETWPDNWTAATKDGRRSAQFEHTLLVTDDGVEILTARVGAVLNKIEWDESAAQAPFADGYFKVSSSSSSESSGSAVGAGGGEGSNGSSSGSDKASTGTGAGTTATLTDNGTTGTTTTRSNEG